MEYPKLEFRASHELEDEVFNLLSSRDFVELEITKSELLRKCFTLGLQIAKGNPGILKLIHEKDFIKADKVK